MHSWLTTDKRTHNSKTNYMTFGSRQQLSKMSDDLKIELGNIGNIVSRASRGVCIIRRISAFIPKSIVERL